MFSSSEYKKNTFSSKLCTFNKVQIYDPTASTN